MMRAVEQRTARIERKVKEIEMSERIAGNRLSDVGCSIVAYAEPVDRRAMLRIVEDLNEWERAWAFRAIGDAASEVLSDIIQQRIDQLG